MGLKEDLVAQMKEAMKNKDKNKLGVIRLLRASIRNEEINNKKELDDGDVIGLIQREIKKRKESITHFKKGERSDLVAKEEAEMAVLYTFLPVQADEDEVRAVVKEIIDAIPEGEKINIGKVMPKAIQKLKGRSDGKTISRIARELMA